MRRPRISTLAGMITTVGLVLALVLTYACRETDVESQQPAETVFLPTLDPEIERAVQRVKQKSAIHIDEATRENVHQAINELAHTHEYVEINGHRAAVSSQAMARLRKIGQPAIPQLVDAAATHDSRLVRQHALGTIFRLTKTEDTNLIEYLPVFVRSMWGRNPGVRGTAVAQIGQMASQFYRRKRQRELERAIPYLAKALSDEDKGVRIHAASCLLRIGRRDLVPEELIEKGEVGRFR